MDFKRHFQPRNHCRVPISHTFIWQFQSKSQQNFEKNMVKTKEKSDFSFLFMSYNQREVGKCEDLSTGKPNACVYAPGLPLNSSVPGQVT